jgi:hypothetical protein
MGGTAPDSASAIAVDSGGNIYTTGYFGGTADFDPGADVYNLTSAGADYIFVSKLDSNGNFVWAKSMAGTYWKSSDDIALDLGGNVYTTGSFYGTVDFDPGAGTYNLTSKWGDIFVSKLDSNGDFVWAKNMGGTESEQGYVHDFSNRIALDSSGNVYTTGGFADTVDFDPGLGTFTLTTDWSFDIFISKLDSYGNFVWAKSMGGTNRDVGYDITLDSSGNIYTIGLFEGIADFDPGADIFNLTSAGADDIFVSRLDSNGNFIWAKSMGGTNRDVGNGIALDLSSNVYTTGFLQGTADFDPGADVYNLTSEGIWDIFICKLAHDAVIQYIQIDIKPGSYPNPINLGSKGVVPVAVLTTAEFDASDLDPASVLFAGAPPLRWVQQDVDWDGDMDLLFHFDTLVLDLNTGSTEAVLTGATFGGLSVEGRDLVMIVPVK